jgi:hypothetical protein
MFVAVLAATGSRIGPSLLLQELTTIAIKAITKIDFKFLIVLN